MSLKTLKQLIDEVKNIVDDDSIPDGWVKSWLNTALGDLTPVLRLEARATALITAGVSEYALPLDMYDVCQMRLFSESMPRRRLSRTDFVTTGYKVWGKTLILQPVPTSDDTVELWYYRVPKTLSDNDDKPEIPEPFQHLLVWYAAATYQAYQHEASLEQQVFYRRYMEGRAALDNYTQSKN